MQRTPERVRLIDAAKQCNVSERTIRRWAANGTIPAFKVGGRVFVTQASIDAFLSGNITSAPKAVAGIDAGHNPDYETAKRDLLMRFGIGRNRVQ